jgi:hypothetical protein
MGQRHQIFIKVANPTLNGINTKGYHETELEKAFGKEETTILAYHNNWLFGRSALQNALNVLQHASQFTPKQKLGQGFGGTQSPLCARYAEQRTIDSLVTAIGFIMGYNPKNLGFLNAGLSDSTFLNVREPATRTDFTLGDNNDGITVIDAIENKYCFMNIYKSGKTLEFNVTDLPTLVPANALDYVRAYYGETEETCNPYYMGDLTETEKTEKLAEFAAQNKLQAEQFEPYGLLSVDELSAMFPKMAAKLRKADKL